MEWSGSFGVEQDEKRDLAKLINATAFSQYLSTSVNRWQVSIVTSMPLSHVFPSLYTRSVRLLSTQAHHIFFWPTLSIHITSNDRRLEAQSVEYVYLSHRLFDACLNRRTAGRFC